MGDEIRVRAHRRAHAPHALASERTEATPPVTRVKSVMSQPLLTVKAEAPLRTARDLLREHAVHHLLVEDRGRLVAIVSDRDIWRGLSPYADGPAATRRDDATLDQPVYRSASFRLVTIDQQALIEEAAAGLLDHGISALPATDERGDITGIVTTRDLLRGLLACALPERA